MLKGGHQSYMQSPIFQSFHETQEKYLFPVTIQK